MANTDRPYGFKPFGSIKQLNCFKCDTTTTAIFRGDVVDAIATGYVAVAAAGSLQMVGSSVGYQAVYATAGTYDIGVYDDPDQMYHAQTVTGTAASRTIINNLCDHIAGTCSAYTLISGHELDISNTTTNATYLGWRLLDFIRNEENDTTLAHAKMICCMNEAARHTIAAGV